MEILTNENNFFKKNQIIIVYLVNQLKSIFKIRVYFQDIKSL